MKKRKNLADKHIECVRLVNGVSNANDRIKKKGRSWKERTFSRSMSGHNFFWLCGLKAENALTLYSPFCHEDAVRCTNLHRSANDIATMNIRIYEVVSGYIAGSANSDTEFHIKYAPYTLGEHNNTSIIIRKGRGERKRQHSEKMFFTHKMNFACAAN